MKVALRKFLQVFVKVSCVLFACLVLLEAYIFCFFTFCRKEWIFEGEGCDICHVVRGTDDQDDLHFRFDDYSSTNGVYTFQASLRDVELEDILSATICVEKKSRDSYPMCQAKFALDMKQTGCGVAFSARLPVEFAPKEPEETLNIEVSFSAVNAYKKLMKPFRMEFKSEVVRHFKSV